jgi:Tfp pilus assembly protein PilV
MFRNIHQKQRGFTIMEALVATFLFSITMSSIVGIYLSTIKLHRRANAIRTVTENVRYISESMSKEIRNGNIDWAEPKPASADVACGRTPVANPDWRIAIVNV